MKAEGLSDLSDKLRRFFFAHGVRTEDDALDLTQETFLRVLQKIAEGEQVLSLEGFAIGIAKHVFHEHCRRAKASDRHDDVSSVVLRSADDPLEKAIGAERRSILQEMLASLPQYAQTLLTRRFMEEVPSRVIAQEEGVSARAIDLRVFRAKRELQKQVAQRAGRSICQTA